MPKENNDNHKPTIETMINTVAIGLTAVGVNMIIAKDYYGFLIILFGMACEFFKYWGRKQKLW